MLEYAHPNLGRLIQPRHYSSIEATAAAGIAWAADNDAFGGFDDLRAKAFELMLERIAPLPGCLFVTAPDVVGDAGLTDKLYEEWAPIIMRHGLPVAYVLQEDGVEAEAMGIPWGAMDCLFIGGASDTFKCSDEVAAIAAEARRRGKWVHMGRVNSLRRVNYAGSIGCDSVDGSSFSKWRSRWLRLGTAWASNASQGQLGVAFS